MVSEKLNSTGTQPRMSSTSKARVNKATVSASVPGDKKSSRKMKFVWPLLLAGATFAQANCNQVFGQCPFGKVCFRESCTNVEQAFVLSMTPLIISLICVGVVLLLSLCGCLCYRGCCCCCSRGKKKIPTQKAESLAPAPYRIGALSAASVAGPPPVTTYIEEEIIQVPSQYRDSQNYRDSNISSNMFDGSEYQENMKYESRPANDSTQIEYRQSFEYVAYPAAALHHYDSGMQVPINNAPQSQLLTGVEYYYDENGYPIDPAHANNLHSIQQSNHGMQQSNMRHSLVQHTDSISSLPQSNMRHSLVQHSDSISSLPQSKMRHSLMQHNDRISSLPQSSIRHSLVQHTDSFSSLPQSSIRHSIQNQPYAEQHSMLGLQPQHQSVQGNEYYVNQTEDLNVGNRAPYPPYAPY